jgi:hypothetical protein
MVARPSQSQQLSSALLSIVVRYRPDLQCPVMIWAAAWVMELRSLSMHDFFGAVGGISFFVWCFGSVCQSDLASSNLSEIPMLRWDREAVGDHATSSAACPASPSALPFPGVPICPLAHTIFADLPSWTRFTKTFWIDLAVRCPDIALECSVWKIALVAVQMDADVRVGPVAVLVP